MLHSEVYHDDFRVSLTLSSAVLPEHQQQTDPYCFWADDEEEKDAHQQLWCGGLASDKR